MASFRLARVLRLRGQLRRLRQIEAQQIEGERDQLDAARSTLDEARRLLLDQTERAFAEGAVRGGDLGLIHRYEEALTSRTAHVEHRLAETGARLAAKRGEVGAERREERKLEHLEERHRAARAGEAALASERQLDELVLARHARERGEERRGR